MPLSPSFAPLAERDFRLLFAAQAVSLLGSWMTPVALAFAVLELTDSPTKLGIVLGAELVPMAVLLLAGGVWADRLPRMRFEVGRPHQNDRSACPLRRLLIGLHDHCPAASSRGTQTSSDETGRW